MPLLVSVDEWVSIKLISSSAAFLPDDEPVVTMKMLTS